MAFEMKRPAKRLAVAAATAVICLSGCAAGSQNVHAPERQPTWSGEKPTLPFKTPKQPAVREENGQYTAFSCSPYHAPATAQKDSVAKARAALARKLGEKNGLAVHSLVGARIKSFYVNQDGHTCVEVEMAKPRVK